MKHYFYFAITFFLFLFAGCAHPIVVSPDTSKIVRNASVPPLEKTVAYYISPENRSLAVTTPGGGGDNVTYYPYRDIETAFYKMLSSVFKDVISLKTPADLTIDKRNVSYVFTPSITTNSSSPSPFTWPPTRFTLNLTCNISDPDGKGFGSKSVIGEGAAEFDEFRSDYSLSAKRAAEDALLKMQNALITSQEFKK